MLHPFVYAVPVQFITVLVNTTEIIEMLDCSVQWTITILGVESSRKNLGSNNVDFFKEISVEIPIAFGAREAQASSNLQMVRSK